MKCPNCGTEIEEEQDFCGNCGYRLEDDRSFFSRHKKLVVFLLLVMFCLGMGLGFFRHQKELEAEQIFVNQCNLVAQQLETGNKEFVQAVEAFVKAKKSAEKHAQLENLQRSRAKLAKVGYLADKLPKDNQWSSSIRLIRKLVRQEMEVYDKAIGFLNGTHNDIGGARSLLLTPMAQARATAGRISIPGANFERTADFGKLDGLLDKYAADNVKQRTIAGAEEALQDYFRFMSRREFRKAYDCFSPKFKKKLSYTKWVISYIRTATTKISRLTSEYISENHVSITYELSDSKKQSKGYVTKKYQGEAELVKVDGQWKIGEL